MRKLVHAAFVAFWAALAMLLLLQLTAPSDAPQDTAPTTGTADASGDESGSGTEPVFGLDEVALHDRTDDCWMAIDGGVYDLSDYIKRHPGPDAVIPPWCGRDASEGMHTKGRGREHTARAWRALERYRIGSLQAGETETTGNSPTD